MQKWKWKEQFRTIKGITGADLMKEECAICRKERAARTAVAQKVGDSEDIRLGEQPFFTAPYIHSLNDPKHAANLRRAMIWAETHGCSINWVTAHDYPLHREDQADIHIYIYIYIYRAVPTNA